MKSKDEKIWKNWWFWVIVILIFIILPFIKPEDIEYEPKNSITNQNNTGFVNQEENEYVEDDIVNEFIKNFRTTSKYELTDIEKGNIRTKYFAHINGQYCELLNATNATANCFQITIHGGNEDDDVDKIVKVYEEVIKALDSTISETNLNNTISKLIKNPSNTCNISDSIIVRLYPIVELSWGKTDCRIEISTTIYN